MPRFCFDRQGAYALEIQPYIQTLSGVVPLNDEDSAAFFEYLDDLSAGIADEDEIQQIFDSWCVIHSSNSYFDLLFDRQKPDFDDRCAVKESLEQRNIFVCESHHELLKNTLLLMERYKLKSAGEKISRIKTAQNPAWLKLP